MRSLPVAIATDGSAEVFDHLDQFGAAVAVPAGEGDEVASASGDGAAVGCTRDRDASAAPELKQPLVSEGAQRPQDCVGVDADHGGQIPCRWQALAWAGLAVGDCAADLGRDLLVQARRIVVVDLDPEHDASYISVIVSSDQRRS